MKSKILEALNSLNQIIYPVIDDETIAQFPCEILFKYTTKTPAMQKAFIEHVQIGIALDRLDDAIVGMDIVQGVLLDLGNDDWDDGGVSDLFIDARMLLTKMENERAAILGYEPLDPMGYLTLPPWQSDGDTERENRFYDRGMARLRERLSQEQAQAHAEKSLAVDDLYPRGE